MGSSSPYRGENKKYLSCHHLDNYLMGFIPSKNRRRPLKGRLQDPCLPILIGFSIINHPFWDTPIFGNTPTPPVMFCFEELRWSRIRNMASPTWKPTRLKRLEVDKYTFYLNCLFVSLVFCWFIKLVFVCCFFGFYWFSWCLYIVCLFVFCWLLIVCMLFVCCFCWLSVFVSLFLCWTLIVCTFVLDVCCLTSGGW